MRQGILSGKTAVVTGGAHGIGKAIADAFLRERSTVHIIDIPPGDWFVGDVSDPRTLERFAADVAARRGRVDCLINNVPPPMAGIDTCGYGDTQQLMDLALSPNVTHVLYDLKHMDPAEHEKLTGVSNERIISNLRALAADPRTHDKIWVRMPLIKDLNDGEETIQAAAALLEELAVKRVSLLGYHEMGVSKARHAGLEFDSFEAPSHERLVEIREQMCSAGIDAEISGVSA